MYNEAFFITEPVGNNAFSYDQRTNKKLFVPALKKIQSFDEVRLLPENSEKITFEDYDFEDILQSCYGLENLYEISLSWTPIYLVDNHNHVLYFWYLARSQGTIDDGAKLYHIDEHADMRDSWEYLMKPDSHVLQKVFDFTNFTLNVGNYIIPAQKEWLIWEIIQIRSEQALKEYLKNNPPSSHHSSVPLNKGEDDTQWSRGISKNIILNLDLDFFQPELDYIDYNLKKQVVLDIAKKADLITICTSPFFIDQERAIRVLKDLFTLSASQPQ